MQHLKWQEGQWRQWRQQQEQQQELQQRLWKQLHQQRQQQQEQQQGARVAGAVAGGQGGGLYVGLPSQGGGPYVGLPSRVFVLSAWREVAEVLLEFGRHLDGISLSCAWQVGEGVSCWVYWVGVLLAWGACRVLGVECWGLGFRVYGFRGLQQMEHWD